VSATEEGRADGGWEKLVGCRLVGLEHEAGGPQLADMLGHHHHLAILQLQNSAKIAI
jgi:hypothetical protein